MSIAKTCKIENCNNIGRYDKKLDGFYLILGMCNKHYLRKYRKQDLNMASTSDRRPSIIDGNIAKIPLGMGAKGGYAIVDKEFAWLDKYNWNKSSDGYALAWVDNKKVLMHRIVTNAQKDQEVDHKYHNRTDNRLSVLRIVDRSKNNMNKGLQSNNHSGYKGIFKVGSYYYAKVTKYGVVYNGGKGFKTKQGAAKRYNELAIEHFGEYAYLNKV